MFTSMASIMSAAPADTTLPLSLPSSLSLSLSSTFLLLRVTRRLVGLASLVTAPPPSREARSPTPSSSLPSAFFNAPEFMASCSSVTSLAWSADTSPPLACTIMSSSLSLSLPSSPLRLLNTAPSIVLMASGVSCRTPREAERERE